MDRGAPAHSSPQLERRSSKLIGGPTYPPVPLLPDTVACPPATSTNDPSPKSRSDRSSAALRGEGILPSRPEDVPPSVVLPTGKMGRYLVTPYSSKEIA